MTSKTSVRSWLAALSVPARLYLGGVFVGASLYKIALPYEFALSIATYQILPLEVINPFALTLPWIELVVGAALILGFWTRESAVLISGMMMMFIVALILALSKDLQMSCGCFASQDTIDEIGLHTVFRDLGWLFLGLYVWIADDGRFGLDRWLTRRRQHV